jgi:hypothetical protein
MLAVKNTPVKHPTYGTGKIVEFYEFYNEVFVDILFETYESPVYMHIEDVQILIKG